MSKFFSAASSENQTRTIFIIAIVLVLATFIVYQPLGKCQFINFDDPVYVTSNDHVKDGLTWSSVRWALTSFEATNWHPITWISHMADVQLFEMNPAAHHFSSLFFHILTSVVLFLLLHRITGALWKSALVAALFALHPQNVESVAWIAERKNIISTLFGLLTIWAYFTYVRKPSIRNYIEVLVVYTVGLMAKPMLVTLPFALFLLDYWPLQRFSSQSALHSTYKSTSENEINETWSKPTVKSIVLEKVPLVVVAIASCIITLHAQASAMAAVAFHYRLKNAIASYPVYLYRMVWPAKLAVLYPIDWYLSNWRVVSAAVLVVGITAFAIWRRRTSPYLAVGWFWYLGTLVPVIGLVQVGLQANADRYAYVPLIGIFIIVAWALGDLVEAHPQTRNAVVSIIALGLLAFGAVTRIQVGYWTESTILFQHALNVTQNNYSAHIALGLALEIGGDRRHAEAEYLKALSTKQKGPKSVALLRLGMLKSFDQKWDEAERYFRESISTSGSHLSFTELGIVLARTGRLKDAEPNLRQAIMTAPSAGDAREARMELGMVLAKDNRAAEAIGQFKELLKLGPDSSVLYLLGQSEQQAGNLPGAVDAYRNALRLDPEFTQARQKLDSILPMVQDANSSK